MINLWPGLTEDQLYPCTVKKPRSSPFCIRRDCLSVMSMSKVKKPLCLPSKTVQQQADHKAARSSDAVPAQLSSGSCAYNHKHENAPVAGRRATTSRLWLVSGAIPEKTRLGAPDLSVAFPAEPQKSL